MAKKEIVTYCYGEKQVWKTRKQALDFFLECMCCSEGAEHERYSRIYCELMRGSNYATDD